MDNIRALERGLDVLFCFGGDQAELGVKDVSQRLGLNKASTSRLLATLASKGLLVENPATRKYSLTYKLYGLVTRQLERVDVRTHALPHMRQLRSLTEETVALYVPLGTERTCIEQIESHLEVRRSAQIGRTRPITSGTTGRVLLAWRSPAEIEQMLDAAPLVALTPATTTDRRRFLAELAEVRERGYSLGVDQTVVGVSGIAGPIRDHTGSVVAALSVSGPSGRFTRERMEQSGRAVVLAAEQVSRALGYGSLPAALEHLTPAAPPAGAARRRPVRVAVAG